MIAALDEIFKKYEAYVKQLDEIFASVRQQYPDCVKCKLECSDCCHALFDLSLVEALYVNRQFIEKIPEARKADLIEGANKVDRKLYQLKRTAFKTRKINA